MSRQLPLAVSLPSPVSLDDFVAGDNHQVLAAVRRLALEPAGQQLYISGPPGSGKSHLLAGAVALAADHGLHAFYLPLKELAPLSPELLADLDRSDLLAIDDLQHVSGDQAWEQALFHLYNRARSADTSLLFAADCGPAALDLSLPDLRSRLAWGTSYLLRPLDDEGRLQLLLRHAHHRGLQLQPAAARWMVTRCSRDPKQLLALLERLDRLSLAQRRRLTLPFVRDQLGSDPE